MSNDLLFSVIPRNTEVPVKSSGGVTRIKKDERADRVKEEDKEKQREEHRADQEAVQKRHGKVIKDDETDDKPEDDSSHLDLFV